ncbi:MAG: TonB-dependent receptor, partial [bacterium]|nr:TonB-dependent receptor [bacterium]
SIFHKYAFQNSMLKGFSLNNAIIWVDGQRPDSISSTTGQVTNYMPAYTRLDVGAAYQGKIFGRRMTLTATVRNLADKKIMEGLQSKGDLRSYRVGLSTKF